MEYKELIKMTVPHLREEAKKLDLKGTSGMKKEELIDVIMEKLGIEAPKKKSKEKRAAALGKKTIKKKIGELVGQRDRARADKNKKQVAQLRRRIHALRRRLRKAA